MLASHYSNCCHPIEDEELELVSKLALTHLMLEEQMIQQVDFLTIRPSKMVFPDFSLTEDQF